MSPNPLFQSRPHFFPVWVRKGKRARRAKTKVREYEQAYIEGNKAGKEVEAAVKQYKSHRRVFTENI